MEQPPPEIRLIEMRDPLRAMALLTRLPVSGADAARMAAAAWAWPLAGLLLALLAGTLAMGALWLGLPPAVAAGLSLIATVILTGGLHEDGLADCADGIWGGHTAERRLDIMKDSRIGSYGALSLILAIGLKWVLLTGLIADGALWLALVLPAMLSRAAMAVVMTALPFAREDGLARHVGRPPPAAAAIAAALAAVATLWALGTMGALVCLVTATAAFGVATLARARIGGQTGDVLGAVQMVTEIAALLVLSAAIAAL